MASSQDPMFLPAITAAKPQRVKAPAGACDSHAHIIGPHSRYALKGRPGVTPPEALLEEYHQTLKTLGIERCVLVQPSAYATDNQNLLDCIAAAPDRTRGISVVDDDIADAELERLKNGGVCGLRFNIRGSGAGSAGNAPPLSFDTVKAFGPRLRALNWHAQFLLLADVFPNADEILKDYPVDIVIDHMGYVDTTKGLDGAGFQCLLRLLKSGRCWIKLSAPYRFSKQDVPYSDVAPYARKLIQTAPDRMLWATDWPHSAVFIPNSGDPRRMPNDGELLDILGDWAPDAAVQKKILVDNPARLYGFAA